MSERLARQRWWIATLYCLAAVLAQGIHAPHGASSAAGLGHATPESCGADHGDSDEPRDSVGPTISACASGCPSCEFLLGHQAPMADPPVAFDAACHPLRAGPIPAAPLPSPSRPRGRSPPLT